MTRTGGVRTAGPVARSGMPSAPGPRPAPAWPHPCTLDPPGHCQAFLGNGSTCARQSCLHSFAVHE